LCFKIRYKVDLRPFQTKPKQIPTISDSKPTKDEYDKDSREEEITKILSKEDKIEYVTVSSDDEQNPHLPEIHSIVSSPPIIPPTSPPPPLPEPIIVIPPWDPLPPPPPTSIPFIQQKEATVNYSPGEGWKCTISN